MRIITLIFVVIFFCVAIRAKSQYSNLKFETYSTSEGLSSSTCLDIYQDSDGFLWFGTIDGLNKFDGYEFKIYRPVINDPSSISNNRINAIVEDNSGYLWIGTSNGLNVFDKETEKFHRLKLGTSASIAGETINDLLFDVHSDNLWIGTNNGLKKISLSGSDPFSDKDLLIEHFLHKSSDLSTIDDDEVTNIVRQGENIWVGTAGNCLNLYEAENGSFRRIPLDISNSFELDHMPKVILVDDNEDFWIGNDLSNLIFWDRNRDVFKQFSFADQNIPIFHLYQDSNGIIWAATDGYGIYFIDKVTGTAQHLTHNPADPFSLPNDQPSKILEDSEGLFWIATYNKGVSKLALSKSSFGHYFYQQGNPASLSSKIAQAVLEDSKGRIWIGADGGGLNLFDEQTGIFKKFRANPKDPFSISSDKILYLLESYDGSIWVCTWDGGISKFNPASQRAVSFQHDPQDPFSIGQNTIWCAVEDSLRRVWAGTQTAGLNLFDPHSNKFYKFLSSPTDDASLISNFVFSLFIDSQNRLFVGTSLGLCTVELNDLDEYIPTEIEFKEIREAGVPGYRVNYITEDHLGNIWVGTDLGLYKLGANLKLQRSYSTKEGLANNIVLGIKEDDQGDIWITTKSGLSRLDSETHDIKNFNVHDGLQGMEFQSKSIDKLHDGRIIIGGINGFNVFDPEDILIESDRIRPVITQLRLFNKIITVGDTVNNRVFLEQPLSETAELTLKYDESYISFDFVALYYQNPGRVQYVYRMKGLDEDFIYAGNNRSANYSNLPPGEYTFEIKASVDGQWEKANKSTIEINVLPPPWKTWWAYALYITLFLLAFWAVIRYYTNKIREEKQREVDQMKLRFFVNVSHEFRTPLTLILNPVDKILSSTDPEEVKTSAQIIQRSARRLLNLVNQLLDFRKMDLGKTPLELVQGDIVKFCKDIFTLFKDLAKAKNVKMDFEASEDGLPALFDPDKVEKIVTNLLSNAIKFTESGGSVVLSVSKIAVTTPGIPFLKKQKALEQVEIKVTDTGIGFKKEQLKDVFGRFFHVDNTKTGTGIGLNFTKGLVELHGGEILVESEYLKGSVFTIRLPLNGRRDLKDTDKPQISGSYSFDLNTIKSAEYEIAISGSSEDSGSFEELNENGAKRPVLLIVEDNKELRLHLKNELRREFKVREAVNGAEGVEKVKKFYPDIVISDIMMPEMDGFEFCRRIKSELETCHIPIILLTARSLEEDRIEGYNTGADEYLPKPFNINVLRARIKNLLEAKARIREKFASIGAIMPSNEITSNTIDEVFLDKATKTILENIDDPDFGLENLLLEIGISRSQFYRKINSLTGQNPSNFIRTIRLKYASELLLKNQYSIKEIAYMSGFNSSAYFTKTFRELFGQTPNQFMEQNLKKVGRN